ncbi:MAG: tail fiber domain-containing protein [Candidatus Omnitrophica bacterium]|nr:tail fiber domain-containing protein [Candidatus Omnitrophota bacterium]
MPNTGFDPRNVEYGGLIAHNTYISGNVGIGTTNPGAQLDLSTDSARKLTTTTWSTGSDARIKTNVQTISNALEIIRKVRPVKFHYTPAFLAGHPSVKDTDYYNFIAQEYQQVFPNSVNEVEGLLYLNSSNMIPYAIAGLKEMDLKIRELTKENRELKARDKEFEDRLKALEEKAGK